MASGEIAVVFWSILVVVLTVAAVAFLVDYVDLEHTVAGYVLIVLAVPAALLVVFVFRRSRARGRGESPPD